MSFKNTSLIWILHIVAFNFQNIDSASMNNTKTLLQDLLQDFNKNVRPVLNQSEAVQVNVQMFARAIKEFDEVKETFSFVAAIGVSWIDEGMVWNPLSYGGINQITVFFSQVWVPDLIIISPSDDLENLGAKWNRIRFYATGLAQWVPADLIQSTCAVNMRNYPFDSQSCTTSFTTLGYTGDEVVVETTYPKINISTFQENAMWDVIDTSALSTKAGVSWQVDFIFHLKRKPSFVIINVILPILSLSLLNVLVFLLPIESGERVSYCITVLLSIAVFMTIVSSLLPQTSEPVPIISYKLFADMAISALIVLVTIFTLRINGKDDAEEKVPNWLKKMYHLTTCSCCKNRKISVKQNTSRLCIKSNKEEFIPCKNEKGVPILKTDSDSEISHQKLSDVVAKEQVTWKKINKMVDWMAFVLFTVASLFSFGVYMAIVTVRVG